MIQLSLNFIEQSGWDDRWNLDGDPLIPGDIPDRARVTRLLGTASQRT
jgi:hypothetical protein